jgi:hypothetical protein
MLCEVIMYVLLALFAIVLVVLIYFAARSNFNWGAITISINFLQVIA